MSLVNDQLLMHMERPSLSEVPDSFRPHYPGISKSIVTSKLAKLLKGSYLTIYVIFKKTLLKLIHKYHSVV